MEHLDEILERILNRDIPENQKIDSFLELDRDIRDIGKDFTPLQKSDAKKQSRYLYTRLAETGDKGQECSELFLKTVDN